MASECLTESFTAEDISDATDFSYLSESPPYDSSIEFDTDFVDTDEDNLKSSSQLEAKRWSNINTGIRTYIRMCRQLNVRPIRIVITQLPQKAMYLRHVKMNNGQCHAFIQALLRNTCLECVELHDNGLAEEDVVKIIHAVNDNKRIYSLGLAGNVMQIEGAKLVDDILRKITCLTHLNLAGCKLGDKEMEYIGAGLESNYGLKWFDLSHNSISVDGCKKLGKAIEDTPKLYYLNLSWNHIRLKGAVALIQGLLSNSSLSTLDLAMNGLGFDGCLALEDTLRENTMLRYFDISNNRINGDGVTFIANGLKRNSTLEVLKIGYNPINIDGCMELLNAVSLHGSKLMELDLQNIPVNKHVLTSAREIATDREFIMTHGRILDVHAVTGFKKETHSRADDHISFVLRFLAALDLRFLPEVFRPFDRHRDGNVRKKDFIRSLKKVNIPLTDRELLILSSNLDKHKTGYINYSALCLDVKNHTRERDKKAKEHSDGAKMKLGLKKTKK